MTRESIAETIIGIIKEVMPHDDCSTLQDDDVPFANRINMDSMDFLDVVLALQKKYKIEIPDEDFGRLRNMKSTLDYLESRLKA
ncbi:MAG: acyl carrier protein [Nitrospirae bacterium]|nr:acyl carrier protein [Nitrospirota bacterium]